MVAGVVVFSFHVAIQLAYLHAQLAYLATHTSDLVVKRAEHRDRSALAHLCCMALQRAMHAVCVLSAPHDCRASSGRLSAPGSPGRQAGPVGPRRRSRTTRAPETHGSGVS